MVIKTRVSLPTLGFSICGRILEEIEDRLVPIRRKWSLGFSMVCK